MSAPAGRFNAAGLKSDPIAETPAASFAFTPGYLTFRADVVMWITFPLSTLSGDVNASHDGAPSTAPDPLMPYCPSGRMSS
jgi:hypothetical protein